MSYIQDGTQKFGVVDSPVTINAVTYIAESAENNNAAQVVEINDAFGSPVGQAIISKNPTGTMRLQFATPTTAKPPSGSLFTWQGDQWYVTSVGETQASGAYAFCTIGITKKIAA